ncbi:MAG TPA: type III polyketide synthase [Rhizomicrobium sp.]|jgi:alkylresorcinol/alkylpyrone synthase|nr:type III polyketide synthase [Rhizomicrobium sp.]
MQPRLLALKSAVPPYVLEQPDVSVRAQALFKGGRDITRLMPVFENTGIDRRYSCVPIDWYTEPHGWTDRNALYIENSVALFEKLTLALLDEAGLQRDDIDAIVVSSTTGIATPSLDALVIEKLGLRRDIRRLPIFGLGCAGGVVGLTRASELAKAHPGSRVLFLVVELCALTFRKNDTSKSNIVATALFGDGAAGAILSTAGDGPALGPGGEYTWPNSLGIMGWDVEEDGLKAVFSQSIPSLVANDFKPILHAYLQRNDMRLADIEGFACHPGGAKVLDALEDAFDIPRGALTESRSVLRDFGNMSAVTALFVLERMKWRERRILMTALGPGFSAVFLSVGGP